MAKRRRRKPNISKTALDQARSAAPAPAPASDESEAPAKPAPTARPAPATASRSRRRRALQSAQLEQRRDKGSVDADYVAELLANPTKVVTEDDLRADYGFVIRDLRNMGILAAALFVALICAALILL